MGGKSLIHIPDHPFEHGLVVPDFRGLFGDSNLWLPALGAVITLTLIDGVESLATASAVDRIDPYRRSTSGAAAHPIPRLAGATIRALVRSFRRPAAEAKHEGHPVRSLSRFGLTPGERRCYERRDTLVWWRHAEIKPDRDGSPRHHEERHRKLL